MTISRLRAANGRFVANGCGVEWQGLDVLSDWFNGRADKAHDMRRRVANRLAEVMEEYAQQNAPWEDRTGAARASLKAFAVHEELVSTVYLGYGSDIYYAVYLENAVYNGTSYAIIGPTIDYFSREEIAYLKGEKT